MRQTDNLGLALYDSTDKMNITGAENSLNHNMELIDAAIAAQTSGGTSGEATQDAVLYTSQELTEEQQTQARANIGAADVDSLNEVRMDCAELDAILSTGAGVIASGYITTFTDCKGGEVVSVSGGAFEVTGRNVFDASSRVDGYILNDSGTEIRDSVSHYYARKIPVMAGMTLTANFAIQRVYLLDASGNLTSRLSNAGGSTYKIPEGVYFIQLQVINSEALDVMYATIDGELGEYEPFVQNTNGVLYPGVSIVSYSESANLLTIEGSKRIDGIEGELSHSKNAVPSSNAVYSELEKLFAHKFTVDGEILHFSADIAERISSIVLSDGAGFTGKNLLDESTIVSGKILNDSGVETADSTDLYYAHFIPVKNMGVRSNVDVRRFYLYDAEKNFLGRTSAYSKDTEVNFAGNVYFVQVQILKTTADATPVCIAYAGDSTEYAPYEHSTLTRPEGSFSAYSDGVQSCSAQIASFSIRDYIPPIEDYDVWEPEEATDAYSCTPLGTYTQTIPALTDELKYSGFLQTYFDAYLGAYPDGYSVTKEDLGLDSGAQATGNYANPVYSYEFRPKNYTHTVLLSAGMNTCEASAYFGLAYFIKGLMEHTEPGLLALYNSTRFIVIPVLCPSGIAHSPLLYANSNDVRINKNFEYNGSWERLKSDRGGEYPDSEVETQMLKRWLNRYAGADFWLDCHTDTGARTAIVHLGTVFCSDTATASKLSANKQKLIDFYRGKGYIAEDASVTLGFGTESKDEASYPKTQYAYDVTHIPSAMMEQFMYSTAWGSDGNTNNDAFAIKHYAAMIRYMVLEMCKGEAEFILID